MNDSLDNNAPEVRAILDNETLSATERYRALEALRQKKKYDTDDGIITPEQEVFIDCKINDLSSAFAYMRAYPDTPPFDADRLANRLMDRPSITERINLGVARKLLRNRKLATDTLLKKVNNIKDKRDVLHDIIVGNRSNKTTTVNTDTGATLVKFREDPMLAISAIKLDIKLEEMQDKLQEQLKQLLGEEDYLEMAITEELDYTPSPNGQTDTETEKEKSIQQNETTETAQQYHDEPALSKNKKTPKKLDKT